jgi:hypothetical protein
LGRTQLFGFIPNETDHAGCGWSFRGEVGEILGGGFARGIQGATIQKCELGWQEFVFSSSDE